VIVEVRAIAKGYYGVERNVGDVFLITDKAHFSKRWMVAVEKPKPDPKPAKAEAKQ
jgi:hypothetical protein